MNEVGSMELIGRSRYALAANGLTIIRFVFSPVLAALILHQNPWWLTFWLGWALGATDLFDGKLARQAEPTRFGAFFDPLADKLVVILAGFALVAVGRFPALPMILITIREIGIQGEAHPRAVCPLTTVVRDLAQHRLVVVHQSQRLAFAGIAVAAGAAGGRVSQHPRGVACAR